MQSKREKVLSFSLRNRLAAVFLDTCVLRRQSSEVCQLSSSDFTAADNFDLIDDRGMNREGSLDTDTVGDLTYGKGCSDTAVASVNYNAFVNLNTCLVSFMDTYMNTYRVTGLELRNVISHLVFCDSVD